MNNGTLPLCGKCFKLAKGNERGVKMKPASGAAKKPSSAQAS